MVVSKAEPDWDVPEDWAPMFNMKEETPSQISLYSDDESGIEELRGIVVDTKNIRREIYVAPGESWTLTTVDEDDASWLNSNEEEEDESDEGESGEGESEEEEEYEEFDHRNEDCDKGFDGHRTFAFDQDEKTRNVAGIQNQSFLKTYGPKEEQLQIMSELAKGASERAAEAGKKLSSFLLGGIHIGMSGMAKHLETIEEVVQNQLEQVDVEEETRDCEENSQVHRRQREGLELLEEREEDMASMKKCDPALLTSKEDSFEQSTVSSMGDTFQEYVKPRLIQQRRMNQNRIGEANVAPAVSVNEPRFIDFDEAYEKSFVEAKNTEKKFLETKDKNVFKEKTSASQTSKHRVVDNSKVPDLLQPKGSTKTKDTKPLISPIRKRSSSRGRERSRSQLRAEMRSHPRSKSREARSRSRNGDEWRRSLSRLRGKSGSRREQIDLTEDDVSRKSRIESAIQESPIVPLPKVHIDSEANGQEVKKYPFPDPRPRETKKVGIAPHEDILVGPRSKQILRQADHTEQPDAGFSFSTLKPRERSLSNRSSPEIRIDEGVEMVPFTARNGASGLLIINSGECNLSTTPKSIRDTLQGKQSTTLTDVEGRCPAPSGRFKTSQQVKRLQQLPNPAKPVPVTKPPTSRWSQRRESIKAANLRDALSNKASRNVFSLQRDRVQSKSRRSTEQLPSADDLNEMIDAITKFKLTAQKLGVAERDLLQAMSFATQENNDEMSTDEYSY